jgi:hypothetical protein
MIAGWWVAPAVVLAGCTVKSPAGARSQQTVNASLVTLEFLPREDVPERKALSLLGSPGEDGYGYEFSDDPLAAGSCRTGPCQQTDTCPPWSQCEVSKTLEIHKREFGKCLGKEYTRDGTRNVTFTTRAHVRADGVVDGAAIGDLEPARSELRGCVERAFREVAFPLEADGLITELTVPVRLEVVKQGGR